MTEQTTLFRDFLNKADFSLMKSLNKDPFATSTGIDHQPREVFSGHYVPVRPTPLLNPDYLAHSETFFNELGLNQGLAHDPNFQKMFSGDLSHLETPMNSFGWATGYALSIYGNEYTSQCPFGTGNGYGDGRAISIFEGLFDNSRFEMQLKGAGRTPYCRGGDGRAVLRSSVREFLAQEFMHTLGIPTSRSLILLMSKTETVSRPWYSEGTNNFDPDVMVENPVAISTRVAPSFLRVGQLELFARRARKNEHPNALKELEMIIDHLINREYKREYKDEILSSLSFEDKVISLAQFYRGRLIKLVSEWIRVGYCQGNFNSDNCAAGGFTLDYGPFGFCEIFDPEFQPWTGGGRHFCFFNQPSAAYTNFKMFVNSLRPVLKEKVIELDRIYEEFPNLMKGELETMWANKLGLDSFIPELFDTLMSLMIETKVDFTIFFRELSHLPHSIETLKRSFYTESNEELNQKWAKWLHEWRELALTNKDEGTLSKKLKLINPKYTWREWLIVPAYQNASKGDYSLIKELQSVFNDPYGEQTKEIEEKYYRLRPKDLTKVGGISHYSCSS